MQVNSWHHKLFISICLLNLESVERNGKNYLKNEIFEYLKNKNSFSDEKNTFSIIFEGLSFGEKIKI